MHPHLQIQIAHQAEAGAANPPQKEGQEMSEYEQIINEANEAKDRLARCAEKLESIGAHRKAKSAMTLVYQIEEWQRRGK